MVLLVCLSAMLALFEIGGVILDVNLLVTCLIGELILFWLCEWLGLRRVVVFFGFLLFCFVN